MHILLDEQMDWRLKPFFDPVHTIETVRERGWLGRRNGDLLAVAEADFDVFITMDRGIAYQQHLPQFDIAVIVVTARSNRLADVEPAMDEVNLVLQQVKSGKLYTIKAG